jgi:inner membrane transporter RhtA
MIKSILLLLIAMVSIQSGASLAKSIFPSLSPAGTTALRLIFATLILLTLFRPWRRKLSMPELKGVVLYGFSLGLMNLLFYFALERIPLGVTVALEFTGPLFIATMSSRRALDFLWVLLAGLGIFLLFPKIGQHQSVDLLGVLYALGAGFFWGTYIHFGKQTTQNIDGKITAAYGMFFAMLIVLPFSFYFGFHERISLAILPLGLAVAIFSSALPYTLEIIAMKEIPLRTFGVLMSLEPAIGALAGLVYLKENLITQEILAIGLIIFSSLGSTLSAVRSRFEV